MDKYIQISADSELEADKVLRLVKKIIQNNTRNEEWGINTNLSAMTAQQSYNEAAGRLAWKIELVFSHK